MIKKFKRLSHPNINYLLRKGFKIQNKEFILKYSPNKTSVNRYSVIISKKVLPKAVKRNKARRRIYEILRLNDDKSSHIDSALIAKKNFNPDQYSYQDLKNIITSLYSSIFKKNEK